jgi:hypothetical protein
LARYSSLDELQARLPANMPCETPNIQHTFVSCSLPDASTLHINLFKVTAARDDFLTHARTAGNFDPQNKQHILYLYGPSFGVTTFALVDEAAIMKDLKRRLGGQIFDPGPPRS